MCHGWLLLVSYRSGGGGFAGGGVGLGLLGRGLLRLLLFADRNDLQDRVLLAMPVAAAIVVTAALLEDDDLLALLRSEEHTSELQSLMRISYAVFCLKKKK